VEIPLRALLVATVRARVALLARRVREMVVRR